MTSFEENKHPRDDDGKFAAKGTSKGTAQENSKRIEAVKKYSDDPSRDMAEMGLTKVVKSGTIKLVKAEPKNFAKQILEAKKSNHNGWAVDAHSIDDYKRDKLFTTPDGLNGVAVEPSGNIVSVFKHNKSTVRGAAKYLLAEAVRNGGDRLDAYGEDLYNIYTKNGFEPVSWIKWNDEYAPPDWKPKNGKKDIVFYRYVGKENVINQTYDDFRGGVRVSRDYDAAMQLRDNKIGGKKNV